MAKQTTAPLAADQASFLWLVAAFAAGFLAVLVFHQGVAWLLHAMGMTPNAPFPRRATWPFGVPQIWSLAFWGGVWGIVLGLALRRMTTPAQYWIAAFLIGALGPTLVSWFVVAPLRGAAPAGGWQIPVMARGLFLNGIWGLGAGLFLRAVQRPVGR